MGPVADAIVNTIRDKNLNPGQLNHDDLKNTKLRSDLQFVQNAEGTIFIMGPPSSGAIAVGQMGIINFTQ